MRRTTTGCRRSMSRGRLMGLRALVSYTYSKSLNYGGSAASGGGAARNRVSRNRVSHTSMSTSSPMRSHRRLDYYPKVLGRSDTGQGGSSPIRSLAAFLSLIPMHRH